MNFGRTSISLLLMYQVLTILPQYNQPADETTVGHSYARDVKFTEDYENIAQRFLKNVLRCNFDDQIFFRRH